MKDLSIVIVNYNNSKLLKECLRSVYSSTHEISFEIFVSDNAPKDDSVQMIKKDFPEVKVIENKENLGFTKASNLGLKLCTGRYAMLLNDDTVTGDGAFDKMVRFMDLNPRAGACGPKLMNPDHSLQRQGGLMGKSFWRSGKPKKVSFVLGACIIVRKETIDLVGILDENFFFYNEDIDWCKRIRDAGFDVYFLPDAEVMHYGGYSTRKIFNKRMFVEGMRGGLYYCKKHYGTIAYALYRALLILFFLLAAFCLVFTLPFQGKGQFLNKLSGYFEIFRIALFGPIEYPWKHD